MLHRTVRIPSGPALLDADLSVPSHCAGLVLFAHGSGSGRHSPRNRQVAAALQARGLATLLLDLLTREEEQADLRTRAFRFDIPRLAARVVDATHWAVGGADAGVIELNEQALQALRAPKALRIVPGATHLFEEADALERVCERAGDWFAAHLATAAAAGPLVTKEQP